MKELMQVASRVLYVCRPYDAEKHNRPGVQRMKCADCGASIVVTPSVLADRRRQAQEAGVELSVVCDSCGIAAAEKTSSSVLSMPSPDEIRGANG